MPYDPNQIVDAQRRERVIKAAIQMMERDGISQNQAADRLRVSRAGMSRDLREYRANGVEGLIRGKSTGRPERFILTEEETNALRLCVVRKKSFALGVEIFISDRACQAHTRVALQAVLDDAARRRRRPQWPLSLRRAGYVTEEQERLFRGRKAFQKVEHLDRRGMMWEDEAGQMHPLMGNSLWESDDMSSNEPFSWLDPLAREVRIGRQTLCSQDVFSGSFLGVSPIGRERDAYRVEDIAEHMLETVLAHGLPDYWRLERGAWENNFIDGIPLAGGIRWGGLDALFTVIRTWKSRGKGGIEVSFNLLQSLIAHESMSIGRVRGEFEQNTKKFLKAVGGDSRAAAHFWPIGEYAEAMRQAMGRFNLRPKERRAFGRDLVVPADLYAEAIRRDLPASEQWRFCPVKKEATVRGGHVETVTDHYPLPFRFRVNGGDKGLYLEHGYPVLIAFHPGHPERGCHVFNGERGARNREGWALGQMLALAPPATDAPQFSMARDEQKLRARRNANAAVTSEFRAITGKRDTEAKKEGRRVSLARDGFGQSARIDNAPRTDAEDDMPILAKARRATSVDDLALKLAARRAQAKADLGVL